VGLGAAAISPAAHAFEPRHHVASPTVELDQPNPLELLSTWAQNPDVEILRAQVTGTQRLHLATLSDFTGDSWRVADQYRQLGLPLPPALPLGTQRTQVTAQVSITRLGGLWLPAPGTPSSASLSGALLEPDDGTLARVTPVTAGLSYSVEGSADAP